MPKKPDNAFIEEYRPLVLSIAGKVRAQFESLCEFDDLVAAGFQGLLDAHSRYDPSRGVQFNTFAYYRIRGSIIDYVRKNTQMSRRAYSQLKAAEAALEVTEHVGEQRAADPKAKGDLDKTTEALHDTLARLTSAWVMAAVGQDETAEEETAEDLLVQEQTKARVREVLKVLPSRELKLIHAFYFEHRRFDLVAEELGISKSWASRLHYKALGRLREALDPPPEQA